MTRKERVIRALRHEESDFVPYQVDLTTQEYEKVAAFLGDRDFMEKQGFHICSCYYSGRPRPIPGRPQRFADDFGVVWNRSGVDKDIGVIDSYVIEDIESHAFQMPEVPEAELRRDIEETLRERGDRFTLFSIGFSMFERVWSLCGMENTLMYMITSPGELTALFDQVCRYNLKLLDIALEYDFDGIYFGDDWGQQKGLIMGPGYWRQFIKPQMKKLYGRAKAAGKFVFQHSCGDIREILGDVIEIGLDCYQTVQPEIYDLPWLKRQYGGSLCFWGGISTQRFLPYATPDEVRRKTVETIRLMGKGGGYIAAPTHAVPGDVPAENVLAMLDAMKGRRA